MIQDGLQKEILSVDDGLLAEEDDSDAPQDAESHDGQSDSDAPQDDVPVTTKSGRKVVPPRKYSDYDMSRKSEW